MFPQNRIQVILATMEGAFTDRLSGLAVLGQALAGHMPRRDSLIALLEARRAYLLDAAVQKYDGWRDVVVPYAELKAAKALSSAAETGGEYIAALTEILARLSENTQQTGLRAARHLHAMAFALLVTLSTLIKSGSRRANRQETPPARALSAAQSFTLARRAARVPLKIWRQQSDCILAIAHPVCLRYALPHPRSEYPSGY